MKNIFSLRYILLVLICLGTRCGVLAQESPNPLTSGRYVKDTRLYYFGIYSDYRDTETFLHANLYVDNRCEFSIDDHAGYLYGVKSQEDKTFIGDNNLDCKFKDEKTEFSFESIYEIGEESWDKGIKATGSISFLYKWDKSKGYLFDGLASGYPNPNVSQLSMEFSDDTLIPNGDNAVVYGGYDAIYFISIIPDAIKFQYCLEEKNEKGKFKEVADEGNVISYNQDMILCATPGFSKNAYNWEYCIGKTETEYGWRKLPVSSSEDGSYVKINGASFFKDEEEFNKAYKAGHKVFIRINTPTKEYVNFPKNNNNIYDVYSNILNYKTRSYALNLSKSVPKIIKHKEKTYCDGTTEVEITLDRSVEEKDRSDFYFLVDNKSLNGDNKYYEWSQEGNVLKIKDLLPSGDEVKSYNLQVSGSFVATQVDIYPPIPVRLKEVNKEDVSCHNGNDGSIIVQAEADIYEYKATLYRDEECKLREKEPIIFKGTEKAKFENLEAGTYYVMLAGDKCEDKSEKISIDQPLESVKIDTLNIIKIMPKAYNSTDGSMSVYVYGGTIYDEKGGYTVILKNSDGVTYSHKEPYIDNGKYMYSFENLPKGKYTMIAQDARYSPSDVNPGDEPCGCMATFSFELIAPDPIKIVVKEEQSIKCNGDNDGVLVAKVTGGISPYTYHWAKGSDEIKGDSILRNAVAGKYCLVVEDANNITSDTVYWEIKQPAPIEISFKVANPTFKNKYGSVEAIVTGGTPPYTYGWTKEGVTVNKLDSLETGEYQFYVMDSKGCEKATTVYVSEPDEIKIDTLVFRHPSCYGTNDGEISLKISGKNSQYTAVWTDNKNAGLTRKGLKPGEYTLKVSDSDGNEIELKYKMEQPEQMKLEVGSAFVLCKGQGRMITASSNVEDAEYLWKRNGREIQSAVGSELFVNQDGVYEVICKKKDSDCSVSASVNVSVSDVDLPIDITMSTDVEVDEKIHGVNISTAKMDKFEWILPDGAEKVSQSDNEIVFIMHTPGTYTVRAVGYKGGCTTEVLQTLNVKGDGEAPLPTADGDPLLKQFIVSPNPTDKEFNVHIELSEKANIKLTLKSPTGAEVETINVSDVTSYDHGYELNGDVTDCVFTLELSTGDNKQKSIQRIRKTIIKNEEK